MYRDLPKPRNHGEITFLGETYPQFIPVMSLSAMLPERWHLELETRNLALGTWHLEPGTCYLRSETWYLEPGTWHLRFEPVPYFFNILIIHYCHVSCRKLRSLTAYFDFCLWFSVAREETHLPKWIINSSVSDLNTIYGPLRLRNYWLQQHQGSKTIVV